MNMDEDDGSKESTEEEEVPDNVLHVDFSRRSSARTPRTAEIVEYDDPLGETKLGHFSDLIELGMVMVTLDSRVAGVEVPPQLRGLPELRLNFSHRFGIEDFAFDEQGVRGSLSFDGKAHYVVIPWHAVFMLYSHSDGTVFLFDHPDEE
ncbi:MAG: ClpXP protease specificity-enhancing factor SspB [Bradymonadaceae bacterium]